MLTSPVLGVICTWMAAAGERGERELQIETPASGEAKRSETPSAEGAVGCGGGRVFLPKPRKHQRKDLELLCLLSPQHIKFAA